MKAKAKPKVRTLVINRKKWWRGRSDLDARLLLPDTNGMKCCLGFYALAAGFKPSRIRGKGTPEDICTTAAQAKNLDGLIEPDKCGSATTVWKDSPTCNKLMEINDDTDLTEPVRESRIAKWFKKIGTKVKFVG